MYVCTSTSYCQCSVAVLLSRPAHCILQYCNVTNPHSIVTQPSSQHRLTNYRLPSACCLQARPGDSSSYSQLTASFRLPHFITSGHIRPFSVLKQLTEFHGSTTPASPSSRHASPTPHAPTFPSCPSRSHSLPTNAGIDYYNTIYASALGQLTQPKSGIKGKK